MSQFRTYLGITALLASSAYGKQKACEEPIIYKGTLNIVLMGGFHDFSEDYAVMFTDRNCDSKAETMELYNKTAGAEHDAERLPKARVRVGTKDDYVFSKDADGVATMELPKQFSGMFQQFVRAAQRKKPEDENPSRRLIRRP